MNYDRLPYLKQEDFPSCEYEKAAAIRKPLREAINTARAMPAHKMDQVVAVLEAALKHIRGEEEDDAQELIVPVVDISGDVDPLDSLLGPAKTEPDSGIG